MTNGAGTGVSGLASATVVLDPGHITLAVDLPTATLPSGASLTLVGTTNSGMILWSLPAGQGSLGAARTASGAPDTYTAPAGLMADLPVTVTLTSADNPAKSATAVLTVRSLNLNLDSALDLRDVLVLGQDWGTSTSRSLLSGGAEVGLADLAILLAGLGF